MTRTGDVAIPTVTPHPIAPDAPLAKWVPWRPVFALEQLPQAAYVWDDTDDAVVWDQPAPITSHGYLTPTVGTVTTPDPGPVPAQYHFVVDAVTPANTALPSYRHIAAQFEGPGREWIFGRELSMTLGQWQISVYPTGNSTTPLQVVGASQPNTTIPSGARETWAVTFDRQAAQTVGTAYKRDATGVWVAAAPSRTTVTTPITDGSSPLRIGGWGSSTADRWPGALYSVEMRTGVTPGAGTVVWRFDADDYPGTGTSYVDPRGRTWTLTTAAAITPKVVGEVPYVWDAPFIGGGFTDAACDFMAFDVDPGEPDELYVFPTVEATLTLANADGAYTPWSSDGRLVYWAPGRRMCVYWLHTSTAEKRWLFSGRVASWQVNADDTVTVTAFDGFPALAQQIGPWTPGTAGDTPRARITAIAATAQYTDPITADIGDVTLSTGETTDAPLDVIEQAALSDGGLFYGDADGSLRYANRLWRAGRTDAPKAWVVSDNVCTVPVVVWNPEAAADDERLATVVRLANVAGLIAVASSADTVWTGGARWVLTHPDPDLWQTQAHGDTLAAHLLAQQSTPSMALSRFDIYGLDPHQASVSDFATDVRRGDRLEVLHEYVDPDGFTGTLDLFAIVLGVGHNLTPDEWVSHYQLSRTVDYRTVEMWDRTVYVWDETAGTAAANNVWRY